METTIHKNLAYKLHYLTRLVMTQLNDEIKPHGVKQGQLPVLCCLWEDDGQTQAELCEKIQVEQPTMANTLRRMERDGLIFRTACDQDRRRSRIFLAARIRSTVTALQDKRVGILDRMTRHMSPEEVETFHRLLDISIHALKSPEPESMKNAGDRKNEEL